MRKILSILVGASMLCLSFFYTPAVQHAHASNLVTCNCLTSDMATYTVGQSPTFTINGATPNSSIQWTVQQNGAAASPPVSFGQQTDSTGHYVWVTGSPFSGTDVGTWVVSMQAGTSTTSVSLTVQAAAAPTSSIPGVSLPVTFGASNFSVNATKLHYATGDTPIFTITGAPASSPITYTYFENGVNTPGTPANAGASTDSNGNFTGSIAGLSSTASASWVVGFAVSTETGVISYTTGSSYPFLLSSSALVSGSVGQVYSGAASYAYSGSAPILQVVVVNLPPGVVPAAPYSLTGSTDTEYQLQVPVTAGRFTVGFTGTPTQGGTFPVFIILGGSSTDPLDVEMVKLVVTGTTVVPTPTPTPVLNPTPTPTPTSIQVPTLDTGSLLQVPTGSSPATASAQPYVPGTLVSSNGTIFLIIAGYQVPFLNWNAFVGLGYSTKNVIKADLTGSGLIQTPGIGSANVPHTWGSWVKYKGTIYYSSEQGMIAAPSMAVFTENNGELKYVLPANKYDIAVIDSAPSLSPLVTNDSRVLY